MWWLVEVIFSVAFSSKSVSSNFVHMFSRLLNGDFILFSEHKTFLTELSEVDWTRWVSYV